MKTKTVRMIFHVACDCGSAETEVVDMPMDLAEVCNAHEYEGADLEEIDGVLYAWGIQSGIEIKPACAGCGRVHDVFCDPECAVSATIVDCGMHGENCVQPA